MISTTQFRYCRAYCLVEFRNGARIC